MPHDAGQQRERIRRERRILIADVAIEPRAVKNLLGNVQIAAGIDDRIEPAFVGLGESESSDDEEKKNERELTPPSSLHRRPVSHTTPDTRSAKSRTA